jgi:glycosyltransferase involved in cell wall biosynthesis
MRVAMVTHLPADLRKPKGGVEAVSSALARALVERGVELTVVDVRAPGAPPRRDPMLPFRVVEVAWRRPALVTNFLVTPRELDRVLRPIAPDVVHVHAIPELYRGRPYPGVLTIHGLGYRDILYQRPRSGKPLAALYYLTFRVSVRRYPRKIVISPYVLEQLGEKPAAGYHTIPNPVEDDFFRVTRRPEPATVLYAGVLSRRKNIAGLVAAAAQLAKRRPGVRYCLAGPWFGDYEPEVRAALQKHRLSESFALLGELDRAALLEELARCTCMVLPSFQETAPMAVEEAMAAGVPVVASNVGGLPWLVEPGRTGFLASPHDTAELARLLGRLVEEPSLVEELGRTARERAWEQFHVDSVAGKTLEVYEEAIREHRARGARSR